MPKLKDFKQGYDNLKDKYNTAQDAWDNLSDFSQKVSDGLSGDHDKIDGYDRSKDGLDDRNDDFDSAEDERANLNEQEQAGSYYNPKDSPYQGNDLKSRLLRLRGIKQGGASTGTVASILFVGGVFISMATGSTFFAAMEKNLTNDAADDARTNTVLHRAFNNIFNGKGLCGKSPLTCKFYTAGKDYVKKWQRAGFSVKGEIIDGTTGASKTGKSEVISDPDKQLTGNDRVSIDEINDTTGSEKPFTNATDLNNAADNSISLRDKLARVVNPLADDFLGTKFNDLLSKFGINKARATPEEKKTNEARDKAAAQTEAEKAKSTAIGSHAKIAYKVIMSTPASVAQPILELACTAYNATRITVGAVKLKWATDLIRFGWPFFRLISKMENGKATEADFQEISDRFSQLMDYLSPSQVSDLKQKVNTGTLTASDRTLMTQFGVDPNTDDDRSKSDITSELDAISNQNALDSIGLQNAIYGDSNYHDTPYQTDVGDSYTDSSLSDLPALVRFTKKFSVGVIGSATITASQIINLTQRYAGLGNPSFGKKNIKSFCIFNKAVGTVQAGAGIAELGTGIASCFTSLTNPVSAGNCIKEIGTKIAAAATMYGLYEATLNAMTAAIAASVIADAPDISSIDLRGPAAGDVIASGMSLLLAHKSMGSGLKPALSTVAAGAYLASTQQTYDQYGDQLAQYDARETPFDLNNRYSFIGQIASAITPYPTAPGAPQTGFSYLSNMFGMMSNLFGSTAQALHSQPSLVTISQADLNARAGVSPSNPNGSCTSDQEKQDSGLLCDSTSGRTLQVVSPRVLQWAKEDATGKTHHLADIIDWMSKEQPNDEGQSEDSGTNDQTCSFLGGIQHLLELDFGGISDCIDSGNKASIQSDGSPVEGSQYDMYVKYCAQRQLEPGSTDIDLDSGSAKNQAWHDGTQCALSYDADGRSSVLDAKEFNKATDTGKGSFMMDAFTYYYNMCYVQYSMASGGDCTGKNASSTPSQGDGNVCSLIDNPHIHYQNPATLADLQKLCSGAGPIPSECPSLNADLRLNPALVNALVSTSSKYDITINNFGWQNDRSNPGDCNGNTFQHPKGNAVDISKLQALSDNQTFSGSYNSEGSAVASSFATDFLATLPPNRGGVGQQGCGGMNPKFPQGAVNVNGAAYFPDSCDHLHIDVRDRTNLSGT